MQLGVQKTTIKSGTSSKRPQKNDIVEIHYKAYRHPENAMFASSHADLGEPLRTEIGTGKVIRGWDEGIMDMDEGEIARLVVRDDFAYGALGYPPIVPPGSTLVYEIELLKIENPADSKFSHHTKGSH